MLLQWLISIVRPIVHEQHHWMPGCKTFRRPLVGTNANICIERCAHCHKSGRSKYNQVLHVCQIRAKLSARHTVGITLQEDQRSKTSCVVALSRKYSRQRPDSHRQDMLDEVGQLFERIAKRHAVSPWIRSAEKHIRSFNIFISRFCMLIYITQFFLLLKLIFQMTLYLIDLFQLWFVWFRLVGQR